jgi:hypothetical protein
MYKNLFEQFEETDSDFYPQKNIDFINSDDEQLSIFKAQIEEKENNVSFENVIDPKSLIYIPDSKEHPKPKRKSRASNSPRFIFNWSVPDFISVDEIIHIIGEKLCLNKNTKKMIKDKFNNNIHNTFAANVIEELNKKTIVKNKNINNIVIGRESGMLGRKRKGDSSNRRHNKYNSDNIIIKIKNILKKYLIIFINNIIKNLIDDVIQRNLILNTLNLNDNNTEYLIKDIDYKFLSEKINKNDNLKLLFLKIKDFLSQKISPKYKTMDPNLNYNKIIIENLLTDNNQKNKDIFNFIFNELNLEDWLDIFIHKKDLNNFPAFNSLKEKQQEIIEKSLVRLENYFKELTKEDDMYFPCFLLLIYNYKRYYSIKKERCSRKNMKSN